MLADHLTKAGIVLRVDDRGVGGSERRQGKTGFDGKVEDALAGMSWLASQPEIDPTQIGLLGHSEGGSWRRSLPFGLARRLLRWPSWCCWRALASRASRCSPSRCVTR
ncbi:MAG: hypothetical protein IPG04_02365 [Polyangiaceae bacterium]|nr:hypothetical protein [Polyangiaceae bacterium]